MSEWKTAQIEYWRYVGIEGALLRAHDALRAEVLSAVSAQYGRAPGGGEARPIKGEYGGSYEIKFTPTVTLTDNKDGEALTIRLVNGKLEWE
jgi:hypothetical protein